MKTKILIGAILCISLLNSCIVQSLEPFYTADDVEFDSNLLGDWIDSDSTKWIIEPYETYPKDTVISSITSAYRIYFGSKSTLNSFEVNLFQLDSIYYLDFMPADDCLPGEIPEDNIMLAMHLLPTHSLAKINFISQEEIQVEWFDSEWLKKLFIQNKIRLDHHFIPSIQYKIKDSLEIIPTFLKDSLGVVHRHDVQVAYPQRSENNYRDENILLTAPTLELQKFIRKYGITGETSNSNALRLTKQ